MNNISDTDARRYQHLLAYVFKPKSFFQLPFTTIEFTCHMIWEDEMDTEVNAVAETAQRDSVKNQA